MLLGTNEKASLTGIQSSSQFHRLNVSDGGGGGGGSVQSVLHAVIY